MSAHSDLQQEIGYAFRDAALLSQALTHASMGGMSANNERLEFLGDRVLGVGVADMLFRSFPDDKEGDLAKRHTALVQQAALVDIARQWGVRTHMKYLDGAFSEAVEADAVEALLGAIFLDGGYQAVAELIEKFWRPLLEKYKAPPTDPKSMLQEWAQAKGLPLPVYTVAHQAGSDHAPVFDIDVTVKGYAPVRAQANNKRAAEKEAAITFLKQIGIL